MIKKHVMTGTLAFVCATGALAAQTPAPKPQQPATPNAPTAPAPTAGAQQTSMTLVGCLYRENQIPGRTPNVAERAGILEDFILADASTGAANPAARPGVTEGATGTAGSKMTGKMYKVEDIADEKLKALVGKRVEVMGRIDPEGGSRASAAGAPTPDKGPGPDAISLPEVKAASIREVPGTCPASPAPSK